MKRIFQFVFNAHDDDDDACACRDCVRAQREYSHVLMRERIERATRDDVMRDAQREWCAYNEFRNMNGARR